MVNVASHAKILDVRPNSEATQTCLLVEKVNKTYGTTRANRDVTLSVAGGEILGLLGANGAGKSTLIKILSGIVAADAGQVELGGKAIDLSRPDPQAARNRGIRVVHQELSLCGNLTVAENFFLEMPDLMRMPLGIERTFAPVVKKAIEDVFPDARIDPGARVEDLTIAARQMVEIARAARDPALSLLILDEPTSSLDRNRAGQLRTFLQGIAARGVPTIYISHKIEEVLSLVTTVAVMENGHVAWRGDASETDVATVFTQMGGRAGDRLEHEGVARIARSGNVLHRFAADDPINRTGEPIALREGEIVGLAGLEGQGQVATLRNRLFDRHQTAFVSGDRRRDGVFPINTVFQNATLGAISASGPWSIVSSERLRERAFPWFDRLGLPRERADHPILNLSGGNQQKALMIRALSTDYPILLLDDPTRGVDIGVKQEIYGVLAEAAEQGRLVVWNSSEDSELVHCDRVLVFSGGTIARVLDRAAMSKAELIEASFSDVGAGLDAHGKEAASLRPLDYIAPVIMVALFALTAYFNPMVLKYAGLDLILAGAIPLVFASLAQTFIVGGSQIDLGIGPFMALVSVVTATWLVEAPPLGLLALIALVCVYAASSFLVTLGQVPSIIATLGLSFIWIGTGYLIQPVPGGTSPAWMSALIYFQFPVVPIPVVIIAVATVLAILFNRSTLGTALRGFGNNPQALEEAGWNPVRYQFYRFGAAGFFALAGGMLITGVYTASDINSGASLTLLSVTALVMGGGTLAGGIIRPFGAVCAAISLTLISLALGQFNLDTDFTPAVQGGLLLAVLLLRTVAPGRRPS